MGWTYDRIAAELGYADRGAAWKAIQRVLVETARTTGTETLRQQMLAEVAELPRVAWEDVTHPQPLVDRMGRVVRDEDGEPIADLQQKAASMQVILRALERLAKLRGLDAPKRSVSASMNVADIDAVVKMAREELARIENEHGEDERRANTIAATVEPPED